MTNHIKNYCEGYNFCNFYENSVVRVELGKNIPTHVEDYSDFFGMYTLAFMLGIKQMAYYMDRII